MLDQLLYTSFFILLQLGYQVKQTQTGIASVYWPGDGQSGNTCADGKPFTEERCHIAHRTWPLGSKVRVCSVSTGACTVTYIGDRGPYGACVRPKLRRDLRCKKKWLVKFKKNDPGHWRGVADLSKCVWRKIGGDGLQRVKLQLLEKLEDET